MGHVWRSGHSVVVFRACGTRLRAPELCLIWHRRCVTYQRSLSFSKWYPTHGRSQEVVCGWFTSENRSSAVPGEACPADSDPWLFFQGPVTCVSLALLCVTWGDGGLHSVAVAGSAGQTHEAQAKRFSQC